MLNIPDFNKLVDILGPEFHEFVKKEQWDDATEYIMGFVTTGQFITRMLDINDDDFDEWFRGYKNHHFAGVRNKIIQHLKE